jgi:hypothetical protein
VTGLFCRCQRPCRKIVLRLPDLDVARSAVLSSLSPPHSRRNYKFAMEQFITWYCSKSRLILNRAVVLRFRLHLQSLGLAAGTVNQRLAAARRLAYEGADSGLLNPKLAAGIRRVKGTVGLQCNYRIRKTIPAPTRKLFCLSPAAFGSWV